eukprot:TRINITY_DN4337_c0_g1_i1.p1 TRINITY_DN4337_c0_g1~~TRINITY_DN4337_c0_g1_i1.p1  ORF type:complete len:120 (-),score=15.56 TRINITY_DN4337_c0_g1_i1:83-415(-)
MAKDLLSSSSSWFGNHLGKQSTNDSSSLESLLIGVCGVIPIGQWYSTGSFVGKLVETINEGCELRLLRSNSSNPSFPIEFGVWMSVIQRNSVWVQLLIEIISQLHVKNVF